MAVKLRNIFSKRASVNPKKAFEYTASKTSKKRKSATAKLSSEDEQMTQQQRTQITANARDQQQNLALVAWAIRMYITSISHFSFHAKTKDEKFNKKLERFMKKQGKRKNFDVAQRHGRDSFMYIFNNRKIVDGDAGWNKLKSGKVQGVEADRIRYPSKGLKKDKIAKNFDKKTGLWVDNYGAVKEYCICKRDKTSFVYDTTIKAKHMIFDGFFTRWDQTRGVSPLSTAIETVAQLYSGWDWTLLKIKLHAMLGIAIFNEGSADGTSGFQHKDTETGEDADENTDKDKYEVQLEDGLMKLELNSGDKVDMMESKQPSDNIVEWSEMICRIALLAVDIPYSFIDSRKSSYTARVGDMVQFDNMVAEKRRRNVDCLDEYTEWKLEWAINEGELKLPKDMDLDDIEWEWVASSNKWLDKLKEVHGDLLAVSAGFTSRQRVCKARDGSDWFEIAAELEQEENVIKDRQIAVVIGQPGQITTREADKNAADDTTPDPDNPDSSPGEKESNEIDNNLIDGMTFKQVKGD